MAFSSLFYLSLHYNVLTTFSCGFRIQVWHNHIPTLTHTRLQNGTKRRFTNLRSSFFNFSCDTASFSLTSLYVYLFRVLIALKTGSKKRFCIEKHRFEMEGFKLNFLITLKTFWLCLSYVYIFGFHNKIPSNCFSWKQNPIF